MASHICRQKGSLPVVIVYATCLLCAMPLVFYPIMLRAIRRRGVVISGRIDAPAITLEIPKILRKVDLYQAFQWSCQSQREQTTIPLSEIVAVQLCPWKMVSVDKDKCTSISWAVQGLLVLDSTEASHYRRLPLIVTGDTIRAARLLRHLADALRVPYLFHADPAGWKAESLRACARDDARMPLEGQVDRS